MRMEKKNKSVGKIILIIVLIFLLVIAIQTPIMIARSNGTFARGNNDEYSVANTQKLESSPLAGKTIVFLGSSVTYGSAAKGESFVDYMVKRDDINVVKEAVSGTVLVDEEVWGKKSYIERMKTIDTSIKADAFVCQLSTNDATMKKELGIVSDGFELENFDTMTVAGAIEYIICYPRQTWNCPVFFYTGTKYDNEYYGQMVELLWEIQEKWDIIIIDLWNDKEMNAVSTEDYKLYMVNGIHPSRAGYREWWTPKFEEYLTDYLVD